MNGTAEPRVEAGDDGSSEGVDYEEHMGWMRRLGVKEKGQWRGRANSLG